MLLRLKPCTGEIILVFLTQRSVVEVKKKSSSYPSLISFVNIQVTFLSSWRKRLLSQSSISQMCFTYYGVLKNTGVYEMHTVWDWASVCLSGCLNLAM